METFYYSMAGIVVSLIIGLLIAILVLEIMHRRSRIKKKESVVDAPKVPIIIREMKLGVRGTVYVKSGENFLAIYAYIQEEVARVDLRNYPGYEIELCTERSYSDRIINWRPVIKPTYSQVLSVHGFHS